ncbi:MAG: peptide deformylase [Solobacterium sp.]|nr:peptide deformylase [Solobacterium sp.]
MLINNDTIIKDNDPFIREKSMPVELPLSDEDRALLQDLYNYVKDSTDPEKAEKLNLRPAVGISAIQVGVPKQLTAVIVPTLDKDGNEITAEFMLANPKIISQSVQPAYLDSGEGCLSVEGEHEGHVVRSARIKVRAYDAITDQEIEIRARGYLAIVLQHEIDHFSGTLFYDKIDHDDPYKEIPGALVI